VIFSQLGHVSMNEDDLTLLYSNRSWKTLRTGHRAGENFVRGYVRNLRLPLSMETEAQCD